MTAHCCIRVASSGCCLINKKGVVSKMEQSTRENCFYLIFYILKSTEKGKGTKQKIRHYAISTPFGQYHSL